MYAVLNLSRGSLRRTARFLSLLALLAGSSVWGQSVQADADDCQRLPENLQPYAMLERVSDVWG